MNDPTREEDPVPGLERLATARMPERDLWPGIQARLAPRRSARWLPLALAASIVAGFAALLVVTLQPTASAPVAVAAAGPGAARELSADTRAIVKANLQMVDRAERELRAALAADPDSRAARALLASTQLRGAELRQLL